MPEWLVILVRSILLFFLSLVLIRIQGKKNPSQMTPFNFVHYSVLAILAALISVNVIKNLPFGLVALLIWGLFPIALDLLAVKSKWLHDWVNGKETVLIKHGKVMEENLLKARLTGEELLRALRFKNAFNLFDVEFAVLETTGDINVMLKSDKKPVTPYDLKAKVAPQTEPQTVILDGNILDEPLASLGQNREWLLGELDSQGISLYNVFLGQVDSSGDLYVDLFDDAVQIPKPQIKEMLFANLEKSQANMLKFALDTNNPQAKDMYAKNNEKLKKLLNKLEPYLLR